eukprot:5858160-Pyramimonas_sp.AAC.1
MMRPSVSTTLDVYFHAHRMFTQSAHETVTFPTGLRWFKELCLLSTAPPSPAQVKEGFVTVPPTLSPGPGGGAPGTRAPKMA